MIDLAPSPGSVASCSTKAAPGERFGGPRSPRPTRLDFATRPRFVVAMAAWFGLLTGLFELAALAAWHQLDTSTVLGAMQMNRHFPWMVPLTHLVLFLLVGLATAAASLLPVHALRGLRWKVWVFASLAFASLLLMVPGMYAWAVVMLSVGLARPCSHFVTKHALGFGKVVRIGLPVMLGIAAVLAAATVYRVNLAEHRALAALPAVAAGAPNVVLVVLDTVAADHMSLFGYHRETTPNLARWAARGVAFSAARSAASWTLPSHASLFTGRWPHELGGVSAGKPLDAAYPTLAEHFAGKGYATAGFVGNTYYCNSWYGLGRGFAHYEDYYEANVVASPAEALRCTAIGRWLIRTCGTAYNVRPETANDLKDAERMNRDFLRWIDAAGESHPSRPFFAFLNYVDAHDPYLPPADAPRHFGEVADTEADVDLIRNWHHRARGGEVDDDDKKLAVDGYDDCLASLDDHLGKLFTDLERRGLLDDSIVVITADHGEQFGEHGKYGHGEGLHREEVGVPLLVIAPGRVPSGRMVATPVSLRDVAATLVDCSGTAAGSKLPGRSLARHWSASSPDQTDGVVLSEVDRRSDSKPHHPAAASLVAEGKLYIREATGREQLFDLASDPGETRDVASDPASVAALTRFRAALDGEVGPLR